MHQNSIIIANLNDKHEIKVQVVLGYGDEFILIYWSHCFYTLHNIPHPQYKHLNLERNGEWYHGTVIYFTDKCVTLNKLQAQF